MDKWIKCKDKLPTKSGNYLVTIEHFDWRQDITEKGQKIAIMCWFEKDGGGFGLLDVIAWMPLPEPYEP